LSQCDACTSVAVCVLAAWWWAAVTGGVGHRESDWWTKPL